MPSTRLVVAYFCLVGIPLLGVIGILWLGHHHLTAPLSVAGAWDVEADLRPLHGQRCGSLLAALRQPFFDVAQSGNTLTVRMGDGRGTIVPGVLHDVRLRFGGSGADCALQWEAAVQGPRERRTLIGTLAIAGCGSCPPIPFRATRRTR